MLVGVKLVLQLCEEVGLLCWGMYEQVVWVVFGFLGEVLVLWVLQLLDYCVDCQCCVDQYVVYLGEVFDVVVCVDVYDVVGNQ